MLTRFLERFNGFSYGIFCNLSDFIAMQNIVMFLLFDKKSWVFYLFGCIVSILNFRAIIPILLLLTINLKYKNINDRILLIAFIIFIANLILYLISNDVRHSNILVDDEIKQALGFCGF